MARKKIREFDGKRLLHKHLQRLANIRLQKELRSVLVTKDTDWAKLAVDHPWLTTTKLVTKPDMLFGQRGKHDLVLLNSDLEAAKTFVNDRIVKEYNIKGVTGGLSHFLIEPFVPHTDEYYFSITPSRETNDIRLSSQGGVEIEASWELISVAKVPVEESIDNFDLEEALKPQLPQDQNKKDQLLKFIKAAYSVYDDLDFTTLEMNPICFATEKDDNQGEEGEFIDIRILDLVAEVDDTASFKNTSNWGNLEFPLPFGKKMFPQEEKVSDLDSQTGASLKLTVLNPRGHVWNLVAGGGASVIYADTVADLGLGQELGNYGEYSGAPTADEMFAYTTQFLELATAHPDEKEKLILIGGGIANFTDVAKTFQGIIKALLCFKTQLKENNAKLYVRRAGPNYERGLQAMRNAAAELELPIEVYGPEVTMTSIVAKAVTQLQKK